MRVSSNSRVVFKYIHFNSIFILQCLSQWADWQCVFLFKYSDKSKSHSLRMLSQGRNKCGNWIIKLWQSFTVKMLIQQQFQCCDQYCYNVNILFSFFPLLFPFNRFLWALTNVFEISHNHLLLFLFHKEISMGTMKTYQSKQSVNNLK